MITLSFEQLPPELQLLLRTLALLPGTEPVPTEMASVVGAVIGADEALETCRSRGLIHRVGMHRWSLPWPVREYLRSLPAPAGELDALHRRMAVYLWEQTAHAEAMVQPHSPSATGVSQDVRSGYAPCLFPDSAAAQAWWFRWAPAVEYCLAWAVDRGDDLLAWQLADVQWGLRLTSGSDPQDGAAVFARGAQAAARQGHPVEADLWSRAAHCTRAAGHVDEAVRLAEHACTVAATGDHRARALHALGLAHLELGDLDRSELLFHESLGVTTRHRHRALTHRNLAWVAARRGDIPTADEHYHAAVWQLSSQDIGDHLAAAWTIVLWAKALLQHGKPHHHARAHTFARLMEPILRRTGTAHYLATALEVAADACPDGHPDFDPTHARDEVARLRAEPHLAHTP